MELPGGLRVVLYWFPYSVPYVIYSYDKSHVIKNFTVDTLA